MYPEFIENCLHDLSGFLFGNMAEAPYKNRNLNEPKRCDNDNAACDNRSV